MIAVVNETARQWAADARERLAGRRGAVLAAARDQFALRGFESTTMRDIADAAGLTASNLYRYFKSKDSMIIEILGDFSDRLLAAYKEVLGTGTTVIETLDALMWLLQQASRQYAPEIEILQGYGRLAALGVTEHYERGAQARLRPALPAHHRGRGGGRTQRRGGPGTDRRRRPRAPVVPDARPRRRLPGACPRVLPAHRAIRRRHPTLTGGPFRQGDRPARALADPSPRGGSRCRPGMRIRQCPGPPLPGPLHGVPAPLATHSRCGQAA